MWLSLKSPRGAGCCSELRDREAKGHGALNVGGQGKGLELARTWKKAEKGKVRFEGKTSKLTKNKRDRELREGFLRSRELFAIGNEGRQAF